MVCGGHCPTSGHSGPRTPVNDLNCRTPPLLGASGHGHYDTTRHVHTRLSNVYTARLRGGSPARGPRPAPIRANLRSGSVSCSLFGRRPTASELVFDVSSSEAAPPPHLRRLAPLAPRELTARVGPPRARAAASCLVATPPREVGPALPGRRVAPASVASLSFSARPSPPPAPH